MCEPTTLAAISLGIGLLGTAYTVDANNKATDAANQQAAENAKAADAQAKNVEQAGYVDEDRIRQRTRQMLASQRAGFAANNVDMGSGSAADILGDTAVMGEQDALTVRANAAREAWGLKAQAVGYQNEMAVNSAANSNRNMGTILTSAASAANQGASIWRNRTAGTTTG